MFNPDALLAEIKADSGVDEMDALLSELSSLEDATSTFTQPARTPAVASNSGLDELDSLMSQVHVTPAAKPPVARAPAPTGADDLDDLMAQLGTSTPAPRTVQPAAVGRGQAAPTLRATPQANPVRPPAGGDDLDDLMAQLGPTTAPARAPAAVNQPAKLAPSQQSTVRASPAASVGGDDLDDLMAQLGPTTAPAQSRAPVTRQGSGTVAAGRGRTIAPAVIPPSSGGDDLDDLMSQLGGPAVPLSQPTQVGRQGNTAPLRVGTAPAPVAPSGGDDLDDLMSQLGAPVAPPSRAAPVQQAAGRGRGSPVAQAQAVRAPSGGDELDDLMSQLGGPAVPLARPGPQSPAQTRTAPQAVAAAPVAQAAGRGRGAPVAQAPATRAPSGGDELDDLMSQLGGPATPSPRGPVQQAAGRGRGAPVAQAPAVRAPSGGDELDDLMSQLGGATPSPRGAPVQQAAGRGRGSPIAQAPAIRAPSGGDDLDDLMSQLGGPAVPLARPGPQSPAQTRTAPQGVAAAPVAQAGRGRGAPVAQAPATRASSGDALDDLLGQLGGPAIPPAQQFKPSTPGRAPASPQTSFNQPSGGDDLDALLGQLGGSPRAPAANRPGPAGVTPAANNFGAPAAGAGRGGAGRPVQTFGSPAPGAGAGRGFPGAAPAAGRGAGGSPLTNTPYSPRTPGQYAPANPNNLDLNNLLDSMNQQMNTIGGGMPISQNICATCNKPILSESISALNKLFHPEHFVCQTCQQPLGTSQFYEQNGNPQCERCYSSIFCPMCAYCNNAITDRCLTAMNKKWHVECFVCNNCCQPFQGGRFFENNGMPYCQGCFEKTFMTRCAGCSQNVSGRIINAMAQQWHQECFVCTYCRRSLVGLPFYEKEGKPYCEAHYFSASSATCAACRQPIQGRCVDALGKKFHPEHFICTYCMNPLAGGGHTEQNGQPYCLECYANLF